MVVWEGVFESEGVTTINPFSFIQRYTKFQKFKKNGGLRKFVRKDFVKAL